MPSRTSFTPPGAVAVVSTGAISFLVSALLDWSIGWRLLAMTLAVGAVVALLTLRPLARLVYPRLTTLSPTLSGWLKRTVEEEHTPTQKAVWLGSAGGAAILSFGVLLFGPGGLTDVSLAGLALSCAGIFAYYASKMCPRRSRRGLAALALAGWFVSLSANFVANAAGGSDAGASRAGPVAPDRALRRDIAEFERAVERGDSNSFFESKGPLRFAKWSADAEHGIAMAQYFTACCLYDGFGVPRNPAAAVPWLQRAAGQDCSYAMVFLGFLYYHGLGGLERNHEHAAALYRSAAGLGNRAGMNYLGSLFRYGEGGLSPDGKPDLREAVRWYERSADLGLALAMRNLAEIYTEGAPPDIPTDAKRGATWYARAAKAGDRESEGILAGRPLAEAIEAYAAAGGSTRERARALKRVESAAARLDRLSMEAHVGMLSDWRMRSAAEKLGADGDPVRVIHDRLVERAIELFRGAPGSRRQRSLASFTWAVTPMVIRWHEAGQASRIASMWNDCLSNVSWSELTWGERDQLIRMLRACVLSLLKAGQRPEAEGQLDAAVELADSILAERPWDWYLKSNTISLCFDAAQAIHDLGDGVRAQRALSRAWQLQGERYGRPDLAARYAGRLPLRGAVPAGAGEADKKFFQLFDNETQKGERPLKKISVDVDFGGEIVPYNVYFIPGPNGYAEVLDQFRWVRDYRGGRIPDDTLGTFQQLHRRSIETRREFYDLCVERFGSTP